MSTLQLLAPTDRAERVAHAVADVACLAGVAADLVVIAESGDTGRIHVLGAVLRALRAQANSAHVLADEMMTLAHRAGTGVHEGGVQ